MSEGCCLKGTSFLPPFQKQRVRCIFNLFNLNLLVVNSHRGQGTGHLLLEGVCTKRDMSGIETGRGRMSMMQAEVKKEDKLMSRSRRGISCRPTRSAWPIHTADAGLPNTPM